MAMASRLLVLCTAYLVSVTSVTGFISTTCLKTNKIFTSVSAPNIHRQRIQLASRSSRCHTENWLKMAEVSIDSLVGKIQSYAPQSKRPDKLFKSIKKANGAPTICVEFSRTPGLPRRNVESVSLAFRRSKAAVICIDTQYPYEGGEQDLEDFVKEQKNAKGNFPGPVGIVWRGKVSDVNDVAKAALAGAAGVALPAEDLSEDALVTLINACYALDMEPFVEVTDKKHVTTAVNAGARIMCIRFTSNAVASFLNYAQVQLRSDIPKECAAVATIAGRQGGLEIEQAQQVLQQGKFDSVLVANFVVDAAENNVDRYAAYVMKEVLSKRSEQFRINDVKGFGTSSSSYGWGAGAGKTPPPGFGGEGSHA